MSKVVKHYQPTKYMVIKTANCRGKICGGRKYVPNKGTRQSFRTKWSGNKQSTQETVQGDDCKMFKEFRELFDE